MTSHVQGLDGAATLTRKHVSAVQPSPAGRLDLCIASMRFHPVYSGPAIRFQRYTPGLRARGVDVRVFTSSAGSEGVGDAGGIDDRTTNGGALGQLLPACDVDGIPVQPVRVPTDDTARKIVYYRALARYCSAAPPSVVQLLDSPAVALPWLLRLRRRGIPLIYTYTLLPPDFPGRRWRAWCRRLEWLARTRALQCVVVSSGIMRDALRQMGGSVRVEVIPNGLDLQRFRPIESPAARARLRSELGLEPEAELVVFVGTMNARKGIDLLVEAWRSISARRPRARLVLVGPDREKAQSWEREPEFAERMRAALDEPELRHRVVLTGTVKNVEEYLRAADVFVFPSRREGMPNVIPEAFGCALPSVITPFVGLPAEFGSPNEQYLLVDHDSGQIGAAIERLLDDAGLRQALGARARRWAEDNLDVAVSLDRYASLYREIANRS